jgi:dipeptidyl-peptidase-4
MYRYTGNGVCLGQIDPGKHEVIDIQRCDPSGNVIYYMASEYDNPTERHAWKADIRTSKNTRITSIPGVHTVSVSDDGLVIDSLSSLTIPLDYNILNRDGKKIKQVYSGKNSTQGYDIPRTELLTITAADDSTKLYGSIIKPENFDSTKQYPLLVYVYGGPRVQLITNKWTMNTGLLPYMMASQGFVVFVLDNRGSMARGAAFEQCTFRNLGSCEVQDQLRGIAFMKTKRYIDSTRIGVYGWSYGGYMTLKLMELAPDVFKVGISGAPVTDWKNYEIMYGERYMDTPEQNPEGYEKSSTLNDVKNIKGKLLLIGGGLDYKTVPKNIADFLNACIEHNVYIDYCTFPNHDHDIGGKDKGYLIQKMIDYFNHNLK